MIIMPGELLDKELDIICGHDVAHATKCKEWVHLMVWSSHGSLCLVKDMENLDEVDKWLHGPMAEIQCAIYCA